jgi:Cu-Zn family superoxide dismutase
MTRIMTQTLTRTLPATLLLLALGLLPACGGGGSDEHDHGDHANAFEDVSKAVCVLSPTSNGEGVAGTVTFTQTKEGLLVEAEVTGLTPNSKHGFHVHQFGDLSKDDGTATGGHYDPTGSDHGLPKEHEGHDHMETGGHAGDFGNLEADDTGKATYSETFYNISLTGKNAVLGRGIIVHANEDDGGQPTGNAGPRIAQGVIGIAKVEEEK